VLQEIVSPVFWSYLVCTSSERADALFKALRSRSRTEGMYKFGLVKVLRLDGDADPTVLRQHEGSQHPYFWFLELCGNLVHLNLFADSPSPTHPSLLVRLASRRSQLPLQGMSGLVLGNINWDAAMLALRQLAPSLRRLQMSATQAGPPPVLPHRITEADRISLPAVNELAVLTFNGTDGPGWLEAHLGTRWDMPAIKKVAFGIGPRQKGRVAPSSSDVFHGGVHYAALCLQDLGLVSKLFMDLTGSRVKELAIGRGCLEVDLDPVQFVECLQQAPKGQAATVKVVVIIDGQYPVDPSDHQDDCLVELVNRRRLPSLEKVVWVDWDKDDASAAWPA
jgi:hypothetical protein